MQLAEAFIRITAKDAEWKKGIANIQAEVTKVTKSMGEKFEAAGKRMSDVGKNLSLKVTAPLVAMGAGAVKLGMDFEAAMSEVGAISGATGNDFKALEGKAKELGASTKFSASQAAEGLKYMAMAGWDTQKMLDGLPGVLKLAAASGEELGTVSDIVTDAMTAFGMEASRAAEFADTLAAASSKSNTNVAMLGESFKYVAPVAGALGYSSKDTAIALGLMANAGIKGSQSGTSLRATISRLIKPMGDGEKIMKELGLSVTNTDGSMKSLHEIMVDLRKAFGQLTPEQQASYAASLAGQEAMSGLLAIVNTSEEDFNNLSDAINNSSGAADEMSKKMMDNLKGKLTELSSALEGVALQFYDAMKPALEAVTASLQKFAGWMATISPKAKVIIVVIAGIAAAIGPLLIVLGMLASSIGAIAGALPILGTVFAALTGPIGLTIAGVAAVTIGIVALVKHLKKDAIPEVQLFGKETSKATKEAVGAYMELDEQAGQSLMHLRLTGEAVTKEMADSLTGTFSQMGEQIKAGMKKDFDKSLANMREYFATSSALSEKEEELILVKMQSNYEARQIAVEEGEKRIKEIMEAASNDKRALTQAELTEIGEIQQGMKEQAVKILSETEVESRAILERMRQQADELTARQAAEVVKNSAEQKDKAIKNAEEQYNKVIKEIIRQRDEAGTISEDQADKLIEEATRQRDEAIKKAEEMHLGVIDEAKKQAGEHVHEVNWETGEILSKWTNFWNRQKRGWDGFWSETKSTWDSNMESLKKGWTEGWASVGKAFEDFGEQIKTSATNLTTNIKEAFANMRIEIPKPKLPHVNVNWRSVGVGNAKVSIPNFNVNWYAKGTKFHPGGWAVVGEEGPELLKLPTGSQVLPNNKLNEVGGQSGETVITGNNFYIREESDIEKVARKLERLRLDKARGRGLAFA